MFVFYILYKYFLYYKLLLQTNTTQFDHLIFVNWIQRCVYWKIGCNTGYSESYLNFKFPHYQNAFKCFEIPTTILYIYFEY